MKKIGIIFSFMVIAAIAGLSVNSCNSTIKDELGTLVLDFGGGGSRTIGADGLPVLSDAKIRVEGSGEVSGAFNKEFSSAEGVSLSFPVGDTVELKVSVLTPSARWSSPPLKVRVEPGTNAVGVKLSKKTAAFHNFLFTRNPGIDHVSPRTFSLKLEDGTDIFQTCKSMGKHAPVLYATIRGVSTLRMPIPPEFRRQDGRWRFMTAKEKSSMRFACLMCPVRRP